MKFLIFAHNLPPKFGVGTFRISSIINEITRSGNHVLSITSVKSGNESYLDALVKGSKREVIKSRNKIIMFLEYFCYSLKYRSKNIDHVIFTGSPFFYFPLCFIFSKKNTHITLDFRDPWGLRPEVLSNKSFFISLKLRFIKLLERFSIKHASKCIVVNDYVKEMYSEAYPSYKKKFHVVENGFFSSVIKKMPLHKEKVINENKFHLVYAGKFGLRNFKPLIEFLKLNDNFVLNYIGEPEPNFLDYLERSNAKEKLNIKFFGKCTYEKTLEIISFSDVAVLITAGNDWEPTTKIYDYIAVEVPILAINATSRSYVNRVLNDTSSGLISQNTPESIKKNIDSVVKSKFEFTNKEKYEREMLSKIYLGVITSNEI
tara:strand:+ start:2616 stop:3734 length:1119 start_codon:yes stop_codon:yes gene_type:complete